MRIYFSDKIYRGYSIFLSEYDFYFIEWSEKMYISWVVKPHFFTSWDEIKVILTPEIWIFFLLYTKFIEEEQTLHFVV